MQNSTLVLDSSALIEGLLSKMLESKDIKIKKLIIPEFVITELESLANNNIEKGFLGIDELKTLRDFSLKLKFEIRYLDKELVKNLASFLILLILFLILDKTSRFAKISS